jgi:hypothetical protein
VVCLFEGTNMYRYSQWGYEGVAISSGEKELGMVRKERCIAAEEVED